MHVCVAAFPVSAAAAWNKLLDAVDHNGGSNVVVVCHAATAAALASHCLHLGPEGLPLMR
jgi:broad specificity phosphatase PhoE